MKGGQKMEGRPSCNLVCPDEAKAFEDNAVALLRQAGLRITAPRVQVIRALSRFNGALSAYEIHQRISSSGGKADVVTVYRILDALQEAGLVHRIGVLDGYFACRTGGSHGEDSQHLVCRSCGCVQEVAVSSGSARHLLAPPEAAGFCVEAIRIEVLGTCSHCLEGTANLA